VLVPSGVDPSKKLTEPVGVPAEEDRVAVKPTALLTNVAFAEEIKLIVGAVLLTANGSGTELLGKKDGSPPYAAVKLCALAERVASKRVAMPSLRTPVPIAVAPS
jgi:hypothetical protein